MDNKQREYLPQLTTVGTIKDNAAGGETLSFTIPMGPLQIICIANVPGDGEREAPVYIKFKLDTKSVQDSLGLNKVPTMRRTRPPAIQYYDDGGNDVEDNVG
jgi:hypothetical protein